MFLGGFSLTNKCCLFRVIASIRLKIMRRINFSSYEGILGFKLP